MFEWLKKHFAGELTVIITILISVFIVSCEPKVRSLTDNIVYVNRAELQLELDHFLALAKIRMIELEKQDQLRTLILQNALLLIQGQPFNPVGILTGIAAIYGTLQGGVNVTSAVRNKLTNRKANNGTG